MITFVRHSGEMKNSSEEKQISGFQEVEEWKRLTSKDLHKEILGCLNCSAWYHEDKYMMPCICKNSQKLEIKLFLFADDKIVYLENHEGLQKK